MIPIQHCSKNSPPRRVASRVSLFATGTLLLAIASANAAEKSYRYFRFEPTKLNASDLIQLAEFTVSNQGTLLNLNNRDGTSVNVVSVTASSTGQGTDGDEDPPKAVDGNLDSKWLRNNPLERKNGLVLDFGGTVTIDAYNFATAGDSQAFGRTPVSWFFSGSDDGIAWTVLDAREDVPIINENKTYQAGFTIPESVDVPPVIDLFEVFIAPDGGHSAVAINGGSIPLRWDTSFSDSVTLAGGGSSTGEAEEAVKYITPPDDSTSPYTLTLTQAGEDDVSASVNLRTVEGGSSTFRYIRYRITERRDAGPAMVQLSEFQFYNGDSSLPANLVPVSTATNDGGSNGIDTGEGALKLIDGDFGSKWLDGNNKPVIFDFGAPATFDRYLFVTGNDATERDPVNWALEGSDDQLTWTLIEDIDFTYPTTTRRNTNSLEIPLPGASLTPLIETFSGDTAIVAAGQSFTLTYSVLGATSVALDGNPLVSHSGTQEVTPAADTTYTLTAVGPNGKGLASATFSVSVIPDPGVNDIAYDDFSAAGPEIILNGDSSINGSHLRLTPALGGQLGGAWFIHKLDTSGGFEATFGLSLNQDEPSTDVPADGIAFVIQNSPLGTTLTGSGEDGVPGNALNLKFRSFGFNPADASKMEVRSGTEILVTRQIFGTPGIDLVGVPGVTLPDNSQPGASNYTIAQLASDPPYRIRVVYVPGDLDVYFDGIAIAQNINVDLQAIGAADANGKSYFGFSGRTGGLVQNNDIADWHVKLGDFSAMQPFGMVRSIIRTSEGAAKPDSLDLVWNAAFEYDYQIMHSDDLLNWDVVTTLPGQDGQVGSSIDISTYGPEKAFFRVSQKTP